MEQPLSSRDRRRFEMTTTTANVSKPADVPSFVDRIVRPLTKILNPLILRIAGGWWFPIFSLLEHRGHKSGRIYKTPISAMPSHGMFWLGLTFGEDAGWARNVIAAGEADLRYRGTDYHLVDATVVDAVDVKAQLPPLMRFGLARLGVHKVIRMRPITKR
jgi:deazaflavin-dependent oxidoreductase (nitroreductase family)